MASIRQFAACIGATGSDISVLGDFFGFSRATVPPGASVSLLQQVNRLALPHFHVNLVRIGSDQFLTADKDELDLSIITIRDIYAAQGFGVGRVEHWGVTTSNAGGLDTPAKKGDLRQITQNWTIDNDGIDVFIPYNWSVPSGPGILLGYSAIGGTCTNKDKTTGLSGATGGLWGTLCGVFSGSAIPQTGRTLAHELGHYLGLFHKNGQPTNLMCQTSKAANSCTSTLLTDSQEKNIANHCAMKEGVLTMRAHGPRSSADDVVDGSAFSTAELRAMVTASQPGLERHVALLVLARRRYPARVADLARVLANQDEPPRMRVLAAEMLGQVGTPASIDALRSGLTVDQPLALRSVVHALGWAGDRESLADLDRLARQGGPAAAPAASAAALVRFRHGEGGDGLPAAGRLLPPDPAAAAAIAVRPASKAAIEAAVADLRASAPGLRLAHDHALAFSCGERRLMVLPVAGTSPGRAIARLLERRTILAVLAEQLALEDDGWEAAQLVLTEPAGARRVRLALVTSRGQLTMDGLAECEDQARARFVLTTVEAPGAVPAMATGSIAQGRLRLDRLEVGTERHRPLAPVRLPPERGAGVRAGRR